MTSSAHDRRGLALAAGFAAAALVPEAVHGAEDVRAGIGPPVALVALLGVQVVGISAALRARRWAARLLLAVAAGWIAGALLDHPEVFSDPGGFRDGWSSTIALLALIAPNLLTVTFTIGPSLRRAE